MLTVTTKPRTQLPDVAPVPVTVQGRPATFRQEAVGSASVTWLQKPGQCVNVRGGNDGVHDWGTRAEVLRIAEGLRDTAMPGQPAFTVALAPADFVLAAFGDTYVTLGPRAGRPDPQSDPTAIVIAAHYVSAGAHSDGKPVTIGKFSGWLAEREGRYTLVLKLSATTRLQIETPSTGPWTENTLARFASGVSYKGSTPRPNG